MHTPQMPPSEARNHATFQALMWALSHPGRTQLIPETGERAFVAVAEALLDLETSFFTPHAELSQALARTGARSLAPDRARYHFFRALGLDDREVLRAVSVGTYIAPDDSATLVIGAVLGRGQTLRLSGPGIREAAELRVEGLPAWFWELRAEAIRYPLGWDIFLLNENRVVGLPRTTIVQVGPKH